MKIVILFGVIRNSFALTEPETPAAYMLTRAQGVKSNALFSVPVNELSLVEDKAYSFWMRWNYFSPSIIDLVKHRDGS